MKKTGIALLCTAALLATASGACAQGYYTLPEVREQAAGGWHQTYEAYGREIVVDVDPYIPEVDTVPLEKLEFARLEMPDMPQSDEWDLVVLPETNTFGFSTHETIKDVPGKREKDHDRTIGYPDEWDRVYPQGSTVTLQEAVDIIREKLTFLGLDADNWDLERPYKLQTYCFKNPKTDEVVAPGEYYLFFHQKINGIPLLNHAGATYQRKTRGHSINELISMMIDRERFILSTCMLKPSGRVAQDVPLCSFSKVIEAFEKEIEEGHIRKAYELEFGYLYYEDPEHVKSNTWTDHFYALPVWQLNCLYVSNRNKELPEYGTEKTGDERAGLEYSSLIVNAQTGELQDFMSTEKDRALYKEFISWDEVQ